VTRIAVDMVDAYVFRRHAGMIQFLLLRRHPDVPLGKTWHAVHGTIEPNESALAAAKRAVLDTVGLRVVDSYSADYVNQFFSHEADAIVLAPVFAFTVDPDQAVTLANDFVDHAWCDTEEATARLLFAGQRWAVRHIEEIIGLAGADAEYHRIR
jgi:dihydroneopterin triphosphate diphosphatase